ncbi:hypothetical protein GRX03_06365 [Halovenus sp. WSH3]|uniref:HTH iclR-type domain-containing protein n=1 Tax=Halovenus carboxidivorans TaxID=2692199 RepID=A0A6B0T256_9EURY|nr:hypothetical protein [Halovenus carboxidivorans]MXR51227.1 hypothetical protein [Halovenus carboxidivorans]
MSPPSRAAVVALLLVSVALATSAPVAGLAAAQEDSVDQEPTDSFGGEPPVHFAAQLQEDGDARWNITTTVSLDTEAEKDAYRATAEQFRAGELPPLGFSTFERGIAGVDGQTARDMEITGFARETSTESEIRNGVGRFTVVFTWENFMLKRNDQLLIDRDVLVMENGELWLSELSEAQTLRISAPPGYGVRDSTVPARNGVLMWEGPTQFDETSLQATFIGTNGGNGVNGNGTNNSTVGPTERSGVFPWILIPVAAIGIAVAVLLTRGDQLQIELPTDLSAGGLLPTGDTTDPAEEETGDSESANTAGTHPPTDVDTELLSDEERVERLLASNGGRMKQADIVKETDWSNAKVSQLLSSMEEEGRIDKLRIGRENLISFPEEDITESEE